MRDSQYDVLVVGSSFTGSLLSWILAKQGRRVLLIDRGTHPRFAIGESSTPTSDFLLAHIADRWNLPELAPMACWGTWKQAYPDVTCGKKRGFSYYRQFPNTLFSDDQNHRNSLLVAASCDDMWSDTHWLRSEVDHFFAKQAVGSGAELLEGTSLEFAGYDSTTQRWSVTMKTPSESRIITTPWIVDSSGAGGAISNWTENPLDDDWMKTKTGTVFAHFRNVERFDDSLYPSHSSEERIFSGDDAAQHQVLDDGWFWLLRMDNGVTSVGIVKPSSLLPEERNFQEQSIRLAWWQQILDHYPGIKAILRDSQIVAPTGGLAYARRLSRCRSRAAGPGWILLPTSFGFIDPLHSTGIAHGLSGITRIAALLLGPDAQRGQGLVEYDRQLHQEIRWLDTLVGGCYRALPSFDRFVAFSSYYFTAAIHFERQMATDPQHWPDGFLMANHSGMRSAADESYELLRRYGSELKDSEFVDHVRRQIALWNHVGLLDPNLKNRLTHTSAPKYASIATGRIPNATILRAAGTDTNLKPQM